MDCPTLTPWYAPELQTVYLFTSLFAPLIVAFLPLFMLLRTPFYRVAELHTSGFKLAVVSCLVNVLFLIELEQRTFGFLGWISLGWRRGFYIFVLSLQLDGSFWYASCAEEHRLYHARKAS